MMNFYGLFIGIDHYDSPNINWLACAKRDAVALNALFGDTFGGHSMLLTDGAGTRKAVLSALSNLKKATEDDLVVISFSGHGSDTHELVLFDSNVSELSKTGIPLVELEVILGDIKCRRILVILDCCFSGGYGARGISSGITARGGESTEDRLMRLSGDGRLVLTASNATERAYEVQKFGHGLLTYFLIEALLGPEPLRSAASIDTYSLLKHVTNRVEDAARQLGRPQHPTMRGSIEGSFTWPIFVPGERYAAVFPARVLPLVTASIASLQPYGFPKELLDVVVTAIPSLNDLQVSAINDFGLLRGEHLVVAAPTSSGKTFIGELAALRGALDRRRTLFLLPLKALVNDKHRHFTNLYSAFGLEVIRATGDISDDIPAFIQGRYDLCLLTYEKFTALVLGNPHLLDGVGAVVIDEVQMLADPSRGVNLELILTLVRLRRQRGIEPQIIALSAVIGDTHGLERWLNGRLLIRTERPVPLDEGVLTSDGSVRYMTSDTTEEKLELDYVSRVIRKPGSQEWVIPLVKRLVSEGKQVIVFRETKGEARGTAGYLAESLALPPAQRALRALAQGDPSLVTDALRRSLNGGVAMHTADLDRDERRVVEEYFRERDSEIRVIAATTTLAMGINTPAEAVVVVGLDHPGKPPQPYSIAEYKNIVGRAGRLGYAERGQSFLLALDAHFEQYAWRHYVNGTPEDLVSRLFSADTELASLVLRILAAARTASGVHLAAMATDDIIGVIAESFGAYQERQKNPQWQLDERELHSALERLEQHQLIAQPPQGTGYQLTELGWLAGHAGLEVDSVIRLVDVLAPLSATELSDPALIASIQLTCELDGVYFPVNSKGARKELSTWTSELQQQQVPYHVLNRLSAYCTGDYQAAARAKRAAACLLWISDFSMSEIEKRLTVHGGQFDGAAGPVRSTASRTRDLLSIATRIAELLHVGFDLSVRTENLAVRLEAGASNDMLWLAMLMGVQLSRADYQMLKRERIHTVEQLRQLSDVDLTRLFSGDEYKTRLMRAAISHADKQNQGATIRPPLLPPYQV